MRKQKYPVKQVPWSVREAGKAHVGERRVRGGGEGWL